MKDTLKYIALTKAVVSFTTKHHVDRGHFADVLGYGGDNASIQFSNTLSPKSDKTFNSMREKLLIDAFDMESKRVYFDEIMRPYGLKTAKMCTVKYDIAHIHLLIDDAQIEADESFKTGKMALRDGTLTKAETEAIKKEATESMKKFEEIILMAEGRLKELEVEG